MDRVAFMEEVWTVVVYLSRNRKGTMRSKMVIDRINEMKMKLDSEISMKAVNSAKRKRVEEAKDLGPGDDRFPGTDSMLTEIAMVPPILLAGTNQPVTKPRGVTAL